MGEYMKRPLWLDYSGVSDGYGTKCLRINLVSVLQYASEVLSGGSSCQLILADLDIMPQRHQKIPDERQHFNKSGALVSG